jgi:hypothetical protein
MSSRWFVPVGLLTLAGLFFAVGDGGAANPRPTSATMPEDRQRAHIIDEVTEDIGTARGREFQKSKGGPEHNKLSTVSSPTRAGKVAFKHWVDQHGERSELAMARTRIGRTYWYGWSMFLTEDFDHRGHYAILMQLAAYPSPRDGKFPCGGNGHMISVGDSGTVSYALQRQGETKDSECEKFSLGDVGAMKGRWVDFVMHARWTGDSDGFLRLWMKIGDGPYDKKIDYEGRTWWNDEGDGPYFKMGLYMGDPGWKGPESRTLITDEYRLGDEQAGFADVAPGDEPVQVPTD